MEKAFWLSLSALVGASAVLSVKWYVDTKNPFWLIAALSLEFSLVFCHVHLLSLGEVEILFVIARMLAVLLVVFAAVLWLSRSTKSWKMWLGVSLALVSMTLLGVA
nr:membrane protein [Marseillevirus futianmevirus]